MAKAASSVATDIQALIQKSGTDVLTFTWPKFYEVSARDRIKSAFMESLSKELAKKSLLLMQGNAVVLVAKDYNFSPVH